MAQQHPRCQCQPSCRRVPDIKKALCKIHTRKCKRASPRSGWEPKYEPNRWNDKQELRETHNCFAYAMNIHDPKQVRACKAMSDCNVPFHQPGSASGHPRFSSQKAKTCPNMIARILGDNPSISMTTFTAKCPAHTSKIALVVDPDEDYHFYRQDSNGMWSHKPGGLPVTNLDSAERPIHDPALCARNYDGPASKLNYEYFCGYMCVPRDKPLHLKIGGSKKTRKVKH